VRMPDIDTITSTGTKLQRPSMWTCVFINDDYTPMEFVTQILIELFHQAKSDAEAITLRIHQEGKSAVGHYPKDIAILKADQTLGAAFVHQYPLQVIPTEL
jgi:ATP-dependent Clp protease adaptor protein ClpS